jgi:hypothetical protein
MNEDSLVQPHLDAHGHDRCNCFPECLRSEVEASAHAFYLQRVAAGIDGSPESDWLAAENFVLGRHAHSPARFLPGGDLFPYSDETAR